MKKFYKTFLASLLAAAMVVTSVPAEILAAPADEIVEEEVTVAEPSDAVVSDAAVVEEEVGEVDPVDPDDYVNDVPLVIAGTRTNLALVIRGGDHISAPIENATHVALDENDEVTGLNSGGDTVYSAFIDSSQGVTGYVVPKYGYSLPSDLKVTVTGSYQGPETTVTYHAITSNDWSKTTKSGLDYLDDPDGYEWGKAVEINIPASTWLTSYMEAGASKQNKPIALTVDGEATVNKASFSVTVDGVQKATDYKTNITTTHSTAISITNSVKAKDLDRYDVVAGIYDGDELVTEIHEGVGSISTDDEDVEFFLSGDGDIFFTTAAYKAMYQAKHEHGYKTVVALTTRADALTQYSVVLDDATYVKSVKAGATGGGDAITTAAGKVTSDGASDVIFKVTPKDNVTVTGVKYFIEGMSAPISAIGYDATHGVFDGETYVATPAVYDDGAVLTEGTSLTSNTYYEKDGDVYFPTEDEEADGTTRYYLVTTLAETAVGSATSMVYGIPYDEDLHEAAALETHVGAITLYIETENTVTFTLPYSASDNTALASIVTSVTDNGLDTSKEYTIVAGTTEVWNGTDEYQKNTQTVAGGKEYTFTITPDNDHKIKSVTAKMPAVPGAAAAPVDLGDGTFGKYKIAKVTGDVSIEVVLQDNDTNIDVQTASAPSNYTVKEVSTGAIVNNSTVKNAKSGDDYTFAVTPDGGYYVSRVSVKTGATATDFTEILPAKDVNGNDRVSANGMKIYTVENLTTDTVIKVEVGAAVDVTKVKNKDAVVTFNGETIADGGKIRAASSEDLLFNVKAAEGATIAGVYYHSAGNKTTLEDVKANVVSKASTNSDGSETYSLTSSMLSADKFIYVVTKRTAAEGTFKATLTSSIDGKEVDPLKMHAGGKIINPTTGAEDASKGARAETIVAATFLKTDGSAIGEGSGTIKYSLGIPSTSKTAIAEVGETDGVLKTTKVAGTDTLTATLESDATFPQIMSYTKSITVTTTALNTMFDKVELGSAVNQNGAKSGLATDSSTIRVYKRGTPSTGVNIDDVVVYNVYPYTTKTNGKSTIDDALDYSEVGDNLAIKSIDFTCDPAVRDTELNPMYQLSSYTAHAEIGSATSTGTVTVTATVTFADDSVLTTAADALTIVDDVYGYFAIPTVTVGTSERYNGRALGIETKSLKTASIKWDIYKVESEGAFKSLTSNNSNELPLDLRTANEDTIKDLIADGSITSVPASTISFNGGKFVDENGYPIEGIAEISSDSSTVTAVKKGEADMILDARVNGCPVAANPINVLVENELSSFTVEIDTQVTADYAGFKGNYYDLADAAGSAAAFVYPTIDKTATVLTSLGTVSEAVVDPTATTKNSTGVAITGVTRNSVIVLPGEELFKPGTIDPRFKLYGWTDGYNWYAIGDKVTVMKPLGLYPLWAYKYDGGIKIYRQNNGAKTPITDNATLTVVQGKTSISLVAAYSEIDTEAGPDSSGDPQYKDEVLSPNQSYLKVVPAETGLVEGTEGYGSNTLKTDMNISGTIDVAISYEVSANEKYSAFGVVGFNISADNVKVASTDEETTYTMNLYTDHAVAAKESAGTALTDAEIAARNKLTIEADQQYTMKAAVLAGSDAKTWNSNFTNVGFSYKSGSNAIVEVETDKDTDTVTFTGVGAGSAVITITAEDAQGNLAIQDVAVTVSAAALKIVPTVAWSTGFEEVQSTGTIYLRSGVENTITWNVEGKTTGDAFLVEDTTEDLDAIINKADIDFMATASSGDYLVESNGDGVVSKSAVVTPTKLGIGQATVTYIEKGTASNPVSKFVKTIPVVTYQAVRFTAPTEALKTTYTVKKGATALEAGKDGFEKVIYERGATTYTFDSKDYSAAWIAEGDTTYDHYYWAATTNVNGPGSITDLEAKVLDLNGTITKTKGDWETDGEVVLAANFSVKKIELSDIPDTITLTDETISTTAANGTDVAVVKMGVTPSTSTSYVFVGGDDANMYMLGIGDRGMKSGGANGVNLTNTYTGTTLTFTPTWYPGKSELNVSSGYDTRVDVLDADVISTASKTSGKSRIDTFTVGKVNDPYSGKQYVGQSVISVYTGGDEDAYKTITLYLNGEYDTGKKDADGNAIYHYMENGKDLVKGVRTVRGEKHYYVDSARVQDGIFTTDDGKKILINNGAQVTTAGKYPYDDGYYYVNASGEIITNQKFTGLVSTGLNADTTKTYYAKEDGKLAKSELVGTNYYDDNCQMALASSSAKEYELTVDHKYYVNASGEVAMAGIFKVAEVDRLFREDGSIVAYADTDVKDGKIVVKGLTYVIDAKDNSAKKDDVFYNTSVNWTVSYPAKVIKGDAAPTLKYTITYTSANTKETKTTEAISVTSVPSGDFSASSTATELTFTATPDLTGYFVDAEGKTPATAAPLTQKYTFRDGGSEGVAGTYTVKSSEFKWSDLGEGGAAPTVTLSLTYGLTIDGVAQEDVVLTNVAIVPVSIASDENTVTYEATYNTLDEAKPTLTDSKRFNKATGKANEYKYKAHAAFTWTLLGKDDTTPKATTKVTYSVTQDGKKVADETFSATATVTLVSSSDTRKTFKAEVTTIDGKKISEEKTYNIKKTDESGNASAMEGIVIEGLWDEYEYAGKPVQPAFTLVDYDVEDGVALAFGTDYTVKYADNKAAGTGKITITGKGNYAGKNLTASFKIVDKFASLEDKTNLAGNVKSIDKISDEFFYDGTAKYPATLTINTKDDGTLTYKYNDATGEYENQGTDAKDVVISVSNNIKAGTAVVSAQGASDKKPKTKTFKIKPLDLSTAGENLVVTINGGENAAYAVKGAMPSVEAVYTNAAGDDIALIPGQDFKVTYKNNKAAGTATATLKGMKNCSKSVDKTFTIDPLDLSELDEEAVSVLALSGKKVSTIKVTITDEYGDVIPAKALNVSVYESGKETALDKKAAIPSEFDIKIEAGKADLKESISIEGLKPVNDFKAKIAVDKAFNKAGIAYTGTPIILTDIVDDKGDNLFENGKITVTVGGTKLTYGEDFEVAGYKNNNKKGKMSFTLRGINNYAGTKVGTVKIVAKTISKIETE